MPGERHQEYREINSESKKEEIDAAIRQAKLDLNKLQSAVLGGDKKTELTTPDPINSINNFYSLEGNKTIVFNLNQVKNYLNAVHQRLQGMQTQKFGEISKENNFTGTILAVQIALKAIDPTKYNIGKINGEYNEITKKAIRQFQVDKKLVGQDGKPGKETIGMLVKSLDGVINAQKAERNEIKGIVEEAFQLNLPGSGLLYSKSLAEKMVNYIVEGNLGTNKDSAIEAQIRSLSQSLFNWKLKYLIDHYNEPLKNNIQEIKKAERQQRENINRTFNQAINGGSTEEVGGIVRTFIDFTKIKSSPSERNPKTKVTQCSATAQKNARNFGINLPNGNAREGVYKPIIDKEHFISSSTKKQNNNSCIDINVSPKNANFADMSVESDTINGRKYGHRAIAFMNNDGQRYVLDPYYSGGYNTKPIPRDKYPRHNRVEQINFYNAPKQSRNT